MTYAIDNANQLINKDSLNRYIELSPKKIIDSIINVFKEVKETIYLHIEKINDMKDSSEELILKLKDSLNTTKGLLSKFDFIENEFYDFSSIRDMLFYILNDKSLLTNISLFKELLNSFYNILLFKLSDEELSYEDYKKEYDKFSSELIDIEQKFYTKIYKPSEKYDKETLLEISNSIFNL